MSEKHTDQDDGPVGRDYRDKPISGPSNVKNIAQADSVNSASVNGTDLGETLPTGFFDDLVPCL